MAISVEAPRFQTGEALLIAGLTGHFSMSDTSGIPPLWERFMGYMGKIPEQLGGEMYGVSYNSTGTEFDYLPGVAVSSDANLPDGFVTVAIPVADYAVFTHRSGIHNIGETYQAIFSQWLPSSGKQLAQTPMFERYGAEMQSGDGPFEIWIPVTE